MVNSSYKTFVIIPQFLVTDELVELADNCIRTWKESSDVVIISVDDCGEYQKAKGADEVLNKSDFVVTMPKNGGFAKACNAGFKKACELSEEDCYIAFSNNDIEVHDRVLPELKRPFEMFDNVAITGITSTKEKTYENVPLKDWTFRGMSEGGQFRDWMQDGGLVFTKKSVLEKIGSYDERFIRGGYEDVDLFLTARDTFGMKIIMNGCAMYWHKQGATRWNTEKIGAVNNFGLESKSIENENLQRFIDKHGFNPHTRQIWFNREIFNE